MLLERMNCGGNEYGAYIIHPTAEAEREISVNIFGVNN